MCLLDFDVGARARSGEGETEDAVTRPLDLRCRASAALRQLDAVTVILHDQ